MEEPVGLENVDRQYVISALSLYVILTFNPGIPSDHVCRF